MPLLATTFVLVVAGGAAASQSDRIKQIIADDAPVVERVDQLRDPVVERATPDEYRQLLETNMVPAVKRIGVLEPHEMKPLTELDGIEASRVLIDDPDLGRVVAVPTIDGHRWCYRFSIYEEGRAHGASGGCGGSFGPNGIAPVWAKGGVRRGEPVRYRVYGTASDDVTRLEIEIDGGGREPVTLRDNVFMWASLDKPTDIHVWRGDRHDVERGPIAM